MSLREDRPGHLRPTASVTRNLICSIRIRFAPTFRHPKEWQWHASDKWQLQQEQTVAIDRALAAYDRRSTAFNQRVSVWNYRGVDEYSEHLRRSIQGMDTTAPRRDCVSFRTRLGWDFCELRAAYDDVENVIRANLKSRGGMDAMLILRSHVGFADTNLNRTWQSILDGHLEMLRVDPLVELDFVQHTDR